MTETPKPYPAPEFHHWEAVDAGPEWRAAEGLELQRLRCRHSTAARCPRPVELILYRGARVRTRWAYCAEHAFGRWVEAGRVLSWRLIEHPALPFPSSSS